MAIRPLLLHPDPRLRRIAAPCGRIDDSVRSLIRDLEDTLDSRIGVGIAAPQIGELRRVIVVDTSRKPGEPSHGRLALVDPVIRRRLGDKVMREGCLSVPDYLGRVRRAAGVLVTALAADGRSVAVYADGLEAVALQHEIDHLDGVLFLDRLANVATDLFRRRAGMAMKQTGYTSPWSSIASATLTKPARLAPLT